MVNIGDFVMFDGGLIAGTVIEIDDQFVTIEEESGFTVTRRVNEIE